MEMKPPSAKAVAIAKHYPVAASFVQLCLDDLDGDERKTREWLNAQAPTGRYMAPSAVSRLVT